MITLLLPLQVHGPHGFHGDLSPLSVIGTFLLVLIVLVALAGAYMWRQGKLILPSLAPRSSPEDGAKKILAESFARGDISSDEFMERSSLLNWTPGNDAIPARRRGERRR